MRKTIAIALAAIAAAVAVGTAAYLSKRPDEDPNVKRGRQLLGIDESDAAIRELRIALKEHPDNQDAKSLLLVALLREEKSLNDWYGLQALVARSKRLHDQTANGGASVKKLEDFLTQSRQELYDKGLDISGADELAELTRQAATYSFASGNDEERDHASVFLAAHGDGTALDHLVDRLKSEKADYVPALLVQLGDTAEPALMAVVASRENLGRQRALDTLAQIHERDAAASLLRPGGSLRGISTSDRPPDLMIDSLGNGVDLLTRDTVLYGIDLRDSVDDAVHARWVALSDDHEHRILVLQGYDQTQANIVTKFYLFTSGKLADLPWDASTEIRTQLAKDGPLGPLSRAGRNVEIAQPGKGTVQVMRAVRRASYKKGDRVRIVKSKADGSVIGVDEFGLISVGLDQPHDGMRVMSVAPATIAALEPTTQDSFGSHRYEATLEGDRLVIRPADPAWIPKQ